MTRHLTKCLADHESAEPVAKASKGKLFRVVVQGKYNPAIWLHLELPATARFADLDRALRKLWLECCGHLSAFKLEGKKRPKPFSLASMLAANPIEWAGPNEIDMQNRVGDIFRKDATLSYEYDFGSTTELSLKVVAEREGWIADPHDVHVLARNDPRTSPAAFARKPRPQ